MAERRMFAKTIIDSDAFLDMPLSTQALYFHLSMRADDEGFINNPKKIQRMIGASDDDAKMLIAKKFIIPFESGVVVIKHWKIHNYIRADRMTETKYEEEKAMLSVKDNGAYTLNDALCEIEEIENLDAENKRKLAYKNSSLPYSFDYKIKRAFEGHICPSCGRTMTSSNKSLMPTVQHNTPISKGGKHELENISVICESCNTSIQDEETGSFNNNEVVEMWDRIVAADNQNIKWFWDLKLLDSVDVSQMSVRCQSDVSIGKDRLGKDKDIKSKYGVFDNVMLKTQELEKLKERFPKDWEDRIDSLSEYMRSKGKQYKDHYATILSWARKEERENKDKPKPVEPKKYKVFEKEDYEKDDFKAEQMPDELRNKLGGLFNAN